MATYEPDELTRTGARGRPPLTSLILCGAGYALGLLHLAGILYERGEFFFGPLLGVLAFLLFFCAVPSAWAHHRRRRPWAGALLLASFAGIPLTIALTVISMPKR